MAPSNGRQMSAFEASMNMEAGPLWFRRQVPLCHFYVVHFKLIIYMIVVLTDFYEGINC